MANELRWIKIFAAFAMLSRSNVLEQDSLFELAHTTKSFTWLLKAHQSIKDTSIATSTVAWHNIGNSRHSMAETVARRRNATRKGFRDSNKTRRYMHEKTVYGVYRQLIDNFFYHLASIISKKLRYDASSMRHTSKCLNQTSTRSCRQLTI